MNDIFAFPIYPRNDYLIYKALLKQGLPVKQNYEGYGNELTKGLLYFMDLTGFQKEELGVNIQHKSIFAWVSFERKQTKDRQFVLNQDLYLMLSRLYGRTTITNLILQSYLMDQYSDDKEYLLWRERVLEEKLANIRMRLLEIEKNGKDNKKEVKMFEEDV